MVPKGFYITAAEMREAGIGVHDNIGDDVKFRPRTVAEMIQRTNIAKGVIDEHMIEHGYAVEAQDDVLAQRCAIVVNEGNAILKKWRKRWSDCAAKTVRDFA